MQSGRNYLRRRWSDYPRHSTYFHIPIYGERHEFRPLNATRAECCPLSRRPCSERHGMDRIGIAFEGAQRQQTLHLWDLESVGAREGAATVRGERHALTALVWPGGLFWFPRSAGPIPAAFGPVAFSLGRCLFRFLCSLTSRSALRLYSASCSNSKNSTRSSGGSILAVAKSSLSCSMSVLSFSVTASRCPSDNS